MEEGKGPEDGVLRYTGDRGWAEKKPTNNFKNAQANRLEENQGSVFCQRPRDGMVSGKVNSILCRRRFERKGFCKLSRERDKKKACRAGDVMVIIRAARA